MLNHVLVIEDSRTIQKIIQLYMGELPTIECVYLENLKDTEIVLQDTLQSSFLCAVVNLNLPDASNGEIIELINRYNIPIIILTASVKSSSSIVYSEKKVIDYIYKKNIKEMEYLAKTISNLYQNQRRHVLVVDDSPESSDTIVDLLSNIKLSSTVVDNGIEALQMLEENTDIELVITDYNMPDMDGIELVENIRQRLNKEELPIIGLSSDNDSQIIVDFLKVGVNDFMNKPIINEELYCRVQNMLSTVDNLKMMQQMANTDFLTKIFNRRYFYTIAEKLYKSSKQQKKMLFLALIDADHFKRINDNFGHEAGDQVLVALVQACKNALPNHAILARYGGEEFTCICQVEDQNQVSELLENLRARVEALTISYKNEIIRITISVGVTIDYAGSFQDMINQADEAVYQAKDSGRNKVVFYSP